MTWTTALPTEPGSYWWRTHPGTVAHVVLVSGGRVHHPCFRSDYAASAMGGQWFGPLVPPADVAPPEGDLI